MRGDKGFQIAFLIQLAGLSLKALKLVFHQFFHFIVRFLKFQLVTRNL
jgi:hypothetical protein